MKKLILILFLLPATAYGQQIFVSPTSVPLWGQVPQTAKISASYMNVEAMYLYGFKTLYDQQAAAYGGGYFGVFWNPLSVAAGDFEVRGGAGYFFRKFPTMNGTHINFQLKVSYKLTNAIGLQYSHISNGFGAFNSLNPGSDNIGITVGL